VPLDDDRSQAGQAGHSRARKAAMKLVLLCTALFLTSCGADPADLCARAAAHVNDCTGADTVAPGTCDADGARHLLTLDCAQVTVAVGQNVTTDSLKTSVNSIACATGIIRDCVAPACTAPTYPGPSTTCSDYIGIEGCGGCQFYACREAEHACGASGYYLGFAEKYCVRFLQSLRPRMSPAGQRFLDAGRDCLMEYVDTQVAVDDSCDDVKNGSLASHVACYKDNGFCQLPVSDQWLLLNTIDPADFQLTEALETGLSCL
jgi:hypothetical protein